MNRALFYYVSQTIVGGGLALIGVSNIVSGESDGVALSLSSTLMIVGGGVILLGNCYHVLNGNTDRIDIGRVSFWLSILGAVLILLAGVLALAT